MMFKVREVEPDRCPARVTPGLCAPGYRQPRPLRELEIGGRPNEQRLPRQGVQPETVILPEIPRLAAEQNPRTELRHEREGRTDRRVALGLGRAGNTCPFRLI